MREGGFWHSFPNSLDDPYVTVKLVTLVAFPPEVVMPIFPLTAPLGTMAVTVVSLTTVKVVAFTPPKATDVVCVRLTPVIVTDVPTVPLVGVKLVICGVTRNFLLVLILPPGVVTVTDPVVAPLGTVVVISASETTVNVAFVPLKLTLVAPVRLVPRILTAVPTLPDDGRVCRDARSPTDKLKTVPALIAPPGTLSHRDCHLCLEPAPPERFARQCSQFVRKSCTASSVYPLG